MQNGYILYQDGNRVIIVTGFKRKSLNRKTGQMLQVWVLASRLNPVKAVQTGRDKVNCGNCPLRGALGQARACYVNVGQAPLGIWKAFKAGRYARLETTAVFSGRTVRFGAYGDPIHLPFNLAAEIARICNGHTGYTHQWRNPLLQSWKTLIMASVETEEQSTQAQSMGWRTFRIGTKKTSQEIVCPNTTKGVQCADCKLCSGTSKRAKSIVIKAHGSGRKFINN